MTRSRHASALLIAFLVASCTSGRALDLLPPESPSGADLATELRRSRMNMTVTITQPDGTSATEEWSAWKLARNVFVDACFGLLRENGEPFTGSRCTATTMMDLQAPEDPSGLPAFREIVPQVNTCGDSLCRAQGALCTAHLLLDLGSAVDEMVIPTGDGLPTYTIPPPDAESAIALAEQAFHYSAWAATIAGDNLRMAANRPDQTNAVCLSTDLSSSFSCGTDCWITYGDSLATTLGEAMHVGEEAATRAADKHAAVADADFARTPDISLAARFAWVDPSMSRGRGAHVLVGGRWDKGLHDRPAGNCPIPPLTGRAAIARDLLRLGAQEPRAVQNLNHSFFDLWSFGVAGDTSLRSRLAERLAMPQIQSWQEEQFLAT